VEQTDVGIDPLDNLAVQLQNKAQDSMGSGMLRPEVEGEVADLGFSHGDCSPLPFVRAKRGRRWR
jgi:hypothetical protein